MVPGAGLEPARGRPRGILSPLRLPVPPPGPMRRPEDGVGSVWRLGSESNRRTRLCRPLHDHSATQPKGPPNRGSTRGDGEGPSQKRQNPFAPAIEQEGPGVSWRSNWSGKRDSNSRPQPWQGCALPTELFPPLAHSSREPGSVKPWRAGARPSGLTPVPAQLGPRHPDIDAHRPQGQRCGQVEEQETDRVGRQGTDRIAIEQHDDGDHLGRGLDLAE